MANFTTRNIILRLANFASINLKIIEVHSCHYLGEDDVVWFENTYGRIN